MAKKVAVLIGSLRKESFNRKIANELIRFAPEGLALEIVEIGSLPLYNEDVEEDAPKEWIDFREKVKAKDAVLFVSPEYNRTIPGALKNAIDVGSRPAKKSVWAGKSGAVITSSPGNLGGFGANHNIRQSVVFLDIPMMQQPEAYLSKINECFDEDGKTLNERTSKFLKSWLESYEQWISLF